MSVIPAYVFSNSPRAPVVANGATAGDVVAVGSGGGCSVPFTIASPLLSVEHYVRDAPLVVGCIHFLDGEDGRKPCISSLAAVTSVGNRKARLSLLHIYGNMQYSNYSVSKRSGGHNQYHIGSSNQNSSWRVGG
ncbi:hypothetical protein SUGI_0178300 [Cryptomeria japonica]|nr:hypothetical protein SUGI_0178300 [Cryptomeria japonica]